MNRVAVSAFRAFSFSALLAAAPCTAHAGFEWTPPAKKSEAADNHALSPLPVMPVEKMPAKTMQETRATESTRNFETIIGFGNDIPLGLATGQIVPDDFAYSFDTDIDPGLRVNWQGGKAWNKVLNEALESHGLKAVIRGQAVRITQAEDGPKTAGTAKMQAHPYKDSAVKDRQGPVDKLHGQSYPRRKPVPFKAESASGAASSTPMPLGPAAGEKPEPSDIIKPEPKGIKHLSANRPVPLFKDTNGNVKTGAQMASKPLKEQVPPVATGNFDIGFWQAAAGENLRDVLTRWAQETGTEIYWDTSYNYDLPENVKLHGTFADAVQTVLKSYEKHGSRPVGKLYPNKPRGPAVLVISNYPPENRTGS